MGQNRKGQRGEIRVGIPADDLLKVKGRGSEHIQGGTLVLERREDTLICAWKYDDCTVILGRKMGRYRVLEVRGAGDPLDDFSSIGLEVGFTDGA